MNAGEVLVLFARPENAMAVHLAHLLQLRGAGDREPVLGDVVPDVDELDDAISAMRDLDAGSALVPGRVRPRRPDPQRCGASVIVSAPASPG